MALGTVARYEKNWPYGNTFDAPLAADFDTDLANQVVAVGLNSSGAVTIGGGNTGVIGVLCVPLGKNVLTGANLEGPLAGDPVTVMKIGEIMNFRVVTNISTGALAAPTAGTKYYGLPSGLISATPVDGAVLIGHTLELLRGQGAMAAARLHVYVVPTPLALDVP